MKIKRLWLCAYGETRSVTGANAFGGKSYGLYTRYNAERPTKVKQSKIEELCEWADLIYIFNDDNDFHNIEYFKTYYPQFVHKIATVFQISDIYGEVGHTELVKRIIEQIEI